MKEKIQGIIFDMDNTLFDLVEAKLEACRSVARHFGRDDWEDLFSYFMRPEYGFEDWRHIRDYLVDRNIFVPAGYRWSCSMYETVKLDSIRPYPGISDVLETLNARGIPLALVTDADMVHARARLDVSGFSGRFEHMVTYEMTGRKKPDHAPFLLALKKLGLGASETVMIGDSPVRDLAPAKEIGMHTVYARYGDRLAGTRGEITGHYCVDDAGDLGELLLPLL
ncbi:MAG TPA: HAD-IA family hydrolase [Methanoregulaceae archaeon]|nr:HAD-IA family hydrolase [Methanoregulaceae archaeon]